MRHTASMHFFGLYWGGACNPTPDNDTYTTLLGTVRHRFAQHGHETPCMAGACLRRAKLTWPADCSVPEEHLTWLDRRPIIVYDASSVKDLVHNEPQFLTSKRVVLPIDVSTALEMDSRISPDSVSW